MTADPLHDAASCPHCARIYLPHGAHTRADGQCKSDAELRDAGWCQMPNWVWFRPCMVSRETLEQA